MDINIRNIKQIAIEYSANFKKFILEYCLTKTVLIMALFSFIFSTVVLFNSTPVFHITSVVLPVNQQPQNQTSASQFAQLLTSAGTTQGAKHDTKFSSSVRSADTAIMLWDKWSLQIFNSDPKNKDSNKIVQEHKLMDRLMSWIGGYELPMYFTYHDLQTYIRNSVKIDTDLYGYEVMVHMYSSNTDFAINFLDDVIRTGDLVAKNFEIKKSRANISALTRDLASLKNSSMTSAFSDRINSEYYKIATLDNDLPYFISVLDTPRSSPYPISPNMLFILLSNLIIFSFLGMFIEFFQKNKDDLW
ncbi:hypothetical protein OAM47_02525 [Gammaproteobacteria bacterium]|nr:hypothetical protein [Gammaproteobacteria bacterium]